MNISLKGLAVLLGNLLLLYLNQLINNTLATFSLAFYVYGLMIAFPAMYLSFTRGFLIVIISAFAVEVADMLPLGSSILAFSAIYTAIAWIRTEFNLFSRWHEFALIQSSNLLVILAYTFFLTHDAFRSIAFWHSTFQMIVLSQVALAVIAPWFFNLQMSLRLLFNKDNKEASTL